MTEDRHTEKIVIVKFPHLRRALTRMRLLVKDEHASWPPATEELTEKGRDLLPLVANIDGIEITMVLRHGVSFQTVHRALWSWDEIEAGVIAAFKTAFGTDVELEVIRETFEPGSAQ